MVHILRPKDTNIDANNRNRLVAEQAFPSQNVDREYIPTGVSFDPAVYGNSGSLHLRSPIFREAEPTAPLPTGGVPRGHTGRGIRGWSGPATRNVAPTFGR